MFAGYFCLDDRVKKLLSALVLFQSFSYFNIVSHFGICAHPRLLEVCAEQLKMIQKQLKKGQRISPSIPISLASTKTQYYETACIYCLKNVAKIPVDKHKVQFYTFSLIISGYAKSVRFNSLFSLYCHSCQVYVHVVVLEQVIITSQTRTITDLQF